MDQQAADVVLVEDRQSVRYLTLNRPAALNALNATVLSRLEQEIDAIDGAGDVRAVVIRAAGERAFCAGADLTEFDGLGAAGVAEVLGRGQRVLAKIERLPVPVIAAIRGHALGGGFELALACHLRIAGRSARLGLPEAMLGLIPGYGGTQRLAAIVGRTAALAVMLADRRLDAERAFALGLLAAEPVDDDELDAAADELATAVAARSPSAVRAILTAMDPGTAAPEALALETSLATLAVVSNDGVEGVAAFRGKRTPRFASA